MKNIRFKFIGVLLLVALALGSCKKWIDTSINTNPDNPEDVPMSSLVPAIQANMAYTLVDGNDLSRVTSQWMQYYDGVARQSYSETNYAWRDGDVDNCWNTAYSGIMYNIRLLIGKAKAAKDNINLGIGDVLMAQALGYTTDLWGDVPFSDGFQGLNQLNPAFDKQAALYTDIIGFLDEAITSLSSTPLIYDAGDFMYPTGDATTQAAQWLKAARGLKARYTLHLCKLDPAAWANALAIINEGTLTSNGDDMQVNFGAGVGQQNPLFQFMDQRGDIRMHKTFIDLLLLRQDPRITAFAAISGDTTRPYYGADFGSSDDVASAPGSAVNSPDSPVLFLTYAEILFMKAECEYHANNADPQIKTDVVNGLTASLNKWGVFNALYVAGYQSLFLDTLNTSALLKEIMTQKYIALFNQAETFNDWRRTNNIIGLLPNTTVGAVRNEIPRRFPYSLGEKSYNSNCPQTTTLWDRVGWDVAK
jgi:hypothetical protein